MSGGGPVLGVVLAGGKSTRLGTDKAWLMFFGSPLLCRTVDLLTRVTGEVLVVGRDPSPCGLEASWLPDEVPGLGPAGGVVTALAATNRPCLVVSCDLPFLDDITLQLLLRGRRARPAGTLMTTFRRRETGYVECLVAVYEPDGGAVLRRALADGERRLSAIFQENRRHHLDFSDEDKALCRAFFNINSPPDLIAARGMEHRA